MNTEYPGITGRELLEKLQELSPEDLEKRIVIGIINSSWAEPDYDLVNFSNGVQVEPGTYSWGVWKPSADGELTFEKCSEPCIQILSAID